MAIARALHRNHADLESHRQLVATEALKAAGTGLVEHTVTADRAIAEACDGLATYERAVKRLIFERERQIASAAKKAESARIAAENAAREKAAAEERKHAAILVQENNRQRAVQQAKEHFAKGSKGSK